MRAAVLFLMVLFVCEGLGMMALSVPLILGRIKPNRFTGVRIPETLSDEKTWYRVNARFGKWFLAAGAAFTLAAIGLFFTPLNTDVAAYSLCCTAVLFATIGAAIAAAFRAI